MTISGCYSFLTPDFAGDYIEETDMRNVLLPTIMIALYALSSTMDFEDAERLRASYQHAKAPTCLSTSANCPTSRQQLALNTP